jgi:hypothetical protein
VEVGELAELRLTQFSLQPHGPDRGTEASLRLRLMPARHLPALLFPGEF